MPSHIASVFVLLSCAYLASAWTPANQAPTADMRSVSRRAEKVVPFSLSRKSSTKTFASSLEEESTAVSSSSSHWLDYLKFGGTTPDFDVIEKTKEYTSTPGYKRFSLKDIPTEYYSDEYVFRGPIVGPINRKDLVEVNGWFGLESAYPDLDRQAFGFSVDPENPYRVLFFERWKATHSGKFDNPTTSYLPVTGNRSESPVMPFSIVWTPEGKIIYEHLTTAMDRFEGNTKGKVAVFGLLESAGLSVNNNVGDKVLIFLQKTLQGKFFSKTKLFSKAKIFSQEEDVPKWWKSKAVGAEMNDI